MLVKSITTKDISLEYALSNKKEEPYESYRYKSKAINFSLEFGSSAFSFARQSLEPEWSLDDCKKYIAENNLQKTYKRQYGVLTSSVNLSEEKEEFEKRNDIFKSITNKKEFAYYWTVAIDIRKKFFDNYSGLKVWIDKCVEEGKNQGYVISPFGAIRRLPELLYKGKDTRDSHYKNLSNIAINTRVQNFEVAIMMLSINEIDKKFKELNLKSTIFNMVHDSIDLYIHKDEIEITKKIIRDTMEQVRPEYNNIPIEAEGEISDPLSLDNPSYWGFGKHWFD